MGLDVHYREKTLMGELVWPFGAYQFRYEGLEKRKKSELSLGEVEKV